MNAWERRGLELAVVALVITIAIAIYDVIRYLCGLQTISENIWANLVTWRSGGYRFSEFPVLTILLPAGVSLQAVGLLVHLAAGLLPGGALHRNMRE